MYLHVLVPSVSSGDTLDVEAEFCDSGETTTQISNMKQIVDASNYCEPFFTLHDHIQVKLGVTAGITATLSMRAAKMWIDNAAGYDGLYAS